MFHSVLVPLDRSPLAEQALPLAVSVARRAGAALDLVEVHALYAFEEPHCERLPYDPAADAELKRQEQLYLDATAKWVAAVWPVPVTTAVVGGLVADGILGRARTGHADLIVMTSHGRHGVDHFFLGSVAEAVIRQAPVPVLVVRPCDPSPSLLPEPVFENVVILLDGSALAEQVLEPALDLARLLEARGTLFRVVETSAVANGSGQGERVGKARAEAEAYLEGIAARVRAPGLEVRARVVVARHAADPILREAQASPQDILALATHGRAGIRRLLLGSVADKIIRGSTAPVLVQPPR